VVKAQDYYSGCRWFEKVPSEIYLSKKFLAADGSGCVLCHT